jgi:hypothetical protein
MKQGTRNTEMEQILYWEDKETPENTGWWIVQLDEEGFQYDAVGPYDTEQEAREMAAKYPLE